MKLTILQKITTFALLVSMSSQLQAVVKPKETANPTLPAIFETSSVQERIKAIRVADLDATRKLSERIYGIQLNSQTTVHDLVLQDDQIEASLSQLVKGAARTEGPLYQKDGQVWVVRAIKLRTIVEEIERTLKQSRTGKREVSISANYKTLDTLVEALGNGALPNSKGLAKIKAKRAAEIDAYRKLAERIMGVQVTSESKVRDFVLASDLIEARMAQVLKGAKATDIQYDSDGNSTVTLQVNLVNVYRILEYYKDSSKIDMSFDTETEEILISEVGYGVVDTIETSGHGSSAQDITSTNFSDAKIVIRELVGTGVVVE